MPKPDEIVTGVTEDFTDEERERLYDEEIMPALREVLKKAGNYGMSVVVHVSYKEDSSGVSILSQKQYPFAHGLVKSAAHSSGDVEEFANLMNRELEKFRRLADQDGGNSYQDKFKSFKEGK